MLIQLSELKGNVLGSAMPTLSFCPIVFISVKQKYDNMINFSCMAIGTCL